MVGIGVTSSDGQPEYTMLSLYCCWRRLSEHKKSETSTVLVMRQAVARLCGRRNESGPRPNAAQQTRFHISTELL